VDTSKPFKVVTQFLTLDGTDSGDITEIKRFYVQNGKRIDFPNANISGMGNVNSMSNQNCQAQMSKFGGSNSFFTNGGMKNIGEALKRGMVLVLSLWDDNGAHMKWLDGLFPENADPSKPGTTNGPCPK
jgi:cellulose 1,4-beta-cellobiosidase